MFRHDAPGVASGKFQNLKGVAGIQVKDHVRAGLACDHQRSGPRQDARQGTSIVRRKYLIGQANIGEGAANCMRVGIEPDRGTGQCEALTRRRARAARRGPRDRFGRRRRRLRARQWRDVGRWRRPRRR